MVVDIVSDAPEDLDVGQTLKLTPVQLTEIQNHNRLNFQNTALQDFVQRDIVDQSNFLSLFFIRGLLFFFALAKYVKHVFISFC